MIASTTFKFFIVATLALAQATCPVTLSTCGDACYQPSQYCCVAGQLVQAALCPSSKSTTVPTTSSTVATTSSTVAAKPSTVAAAPSTVATPQTSSATATTCQIADYCPAGLCACDGACYKPSQYCCLNGHLTQAAFCAPAATTSSAAAAQKTTSAAAQKTTTAAQAQKTTTSAAAQKTTTSAAAQKTTTSAAAQKTTSVAPQKTTTSAAQKTTTAAQAQKTTSAASQKTTSAAQTTAAKQTTTAAQAQKTSSTTAQQATPTTSGAVNVNPAPVPVQPVQGSNKNNCSNGQLSCAGQCYDPSLYGCSSDASGVQRFLCPAPQPAKQSKFWVETIAHQGTSPFLQDSSYVVYRNVKDFGAVGDGVTDDTAAINSAITAHGRCGLGCDSTTTRFAVVYFPAGRYLISAPIIQYYQTQLIGDATNLPTIVAAPAFAGMAMVDSDPYANTGNNWYTNQNNFYRQIRNFVFDSTLTPSGKPTTCIHWQVAQATSLTNLVFKMTPGSSHQGIWMENGSGGWMADLVFHGGAFALWVGNQQFTSRNISIHGTTTGIYMNWNWGWTFKNLYITGATTGVEMTSSGDKGQNLVASVILMDVNIVNTQVAVKTSTPNAASPATSNSLLIDNGYFTNVATVVASSSGSTLVAGNSAGTTYVSTWAQGHVYNTAAQSTTTSGNLPQAKRPAALVDASQGNNYYFEKPKPQYENYDASAFVSVKNEGAKGDGVTDDTAAIQTVLYRYAGCRIIYFPAGTYILSSTVVVPVGSRVVGEAWSTLMADGKAFQDPTNPVPMLQVGKPGDVGVVELSDLLFTSRGPQTGAILVQWNIQDPTGAQGSAGMWDCHFRVGGAAGNDQQIATCPKYQQPTTQCMGTFMLLHITSTASVYLENIWAWTADHDLDAFGSDMSGQISVFNGRGILVESTAAAWLYGTASEHNWFYQYQFDGAENVFMAMIQTETPYYQPAPYNAPWARNAAYNDPDFSQCPAGSPSCEMAWGARFIDTKNVYTYGAGIYNFFSYYNQTCLDTENCQEAIVDILTEETSELYLYGLNTKASVGMVHANGEIAAVAAQNVNTFCSTVHYLANAQSK